MMGMTTGDESYENFNDVTSFDDWYKAMCRVEFDASVMSEVLIYILQPTLREKTFTMEIWADRFLKDEKFMKFPFNQQLFMVQNERMMAMLDPNPADPIEATIHKYYDQNRNWAEVWNPHFLMVSRHMAKFVEFAEQDVEIAIKFLEEFITIHTTDGVPFRNEAQKFHDLVSGTVVTLFKTP
jgi:hypothetical protein